MNRTRFVGVALLFILGVAPRLVMAESPPSEASPTIKPSSEVMPAADDGPTPSKPASAPAVFGLSINEILVLIAVFAVFLCMAVVMRRWLAPREPEEAQPQDAPP